MSDLIRGMLRNCFLAAALTVCAEAPAWAQTSVNGASMAYQSFQSFAAGGSDSGVNAMLTQNGYVGTYINLTQPSAVSFTVKASGTASNGVNPDMTLSIADYNQSFNVNSTTQANYTFTTPTLPAGMYFVRTQLDNSGTQMINSTATSVTPTLTVGNLSISTASNVATVVNTASDANALSAANNYISNFRQGAATVSTGFTSGSSIQVSMVRNAFNFGGTVSGVTVGDNKDMLNTKNLTTTTEAGQFQSFINSYFNTIVPSNGGKWSSNEATQNNITMQLVDEQLAYAKSHNMQARMHNLIWGSGATMGNQQPGFVNTLLTTATGGGAGATAAKQSLATDITNRIGYYLSGVSSSSNVVNGKTVTYGTGDIRATDFSEIDVLNEGLNNPAYWNTFPNSTVAGGTTPIDSIDTIYHQVAQAAAAAGNPNLKLLTNEYNVLQFSPQTISTAGVENGSDPSANWYRNEVESINNGGIQDFGSKVASEIGMELYANVTGSNQPSANTMQKALQNLSVEGLPLSMNEFGMAPGTAAADAQSATKGVKALSDAVTILYGNPLADTFMVWGWWDIAADSPPPAQMIVTSTSGGGYTLTPLGQEWVSLMNSFTTPSQPVLVNSNGTIQFNGFYGEYALKVGGITYATVDFEKGPNDTPLETLWVKGDFNLDGKLNNADLQAMLNALKNENSYQASNGMSNEEFNAICDINGDGIFNTQDILGMMQLLTSGIQAGNGVFGGGSLAAVPEPDTAALLILAVGIFSLFYKKQCGA